MYDVSEGRFLARDPIDASVGDSNLYRYVYDRPTYGSDPLGTDIYVLVDPTRARADNNALERLEKEAKAWNDCIDNLLKLFGDPAKPPTKKLRIGEREVTQQELIGYLKSMTMRVQQMDKAKNVAEAMKNLNEFLKDKKETDQVLFETHSAPRPGSGEAWELNVGGKAGVELDYFMKNIASTKAKFVVGACYWTQAQAERLAKAMKTDVGASGGDKHTSFGSCGYRTEYDKSTKKPVAFQFEQKTPFATAEFRKSGKE